MAMTQQTGPARLLPRNAPRARLLVDGAQIEAWEGESVLVAILAAGVALRPLEESGPRAGFCLMGACQECSVWSEDGSAIRACAARVADGMRILTRRPTGDGADA